MESSDKTRLILSVFFGEPAFDNQTIKIRDCDNVIDDLEELLNQNILELENIYQFLRIQKFILYELYHKELLWEMIMMVKDFITKEDVLVILQTHTTQAHLQRLFDAFAHLMNNIPIENISINQYVELHSEEQLIIWLDKQSIETIVRKWTSYDDDSEEEENTFMKDYVLNRIDEITNIRNMYVISALICLVGPHELIDEQIEFEILNHKYNVLSHIIHKMNEDNHCEYSIGNNYIQSVYERIVGEIVDHDRYAMYYNVCKQRNSFGYGIFYDGKVAIYRFFIQLERCDLSEELLDESELLRERFDSIINNFYDILIPTHFKNTVLVEEQVNEFEKLTADIRDFMHRIIDI